jgi:hypothetical protein
MAEQEFESWREELMFTGAIVQDGEQSVGFPEREVRFNRYLQLVDAVAGTEGPRVAAALIQSMTAREDYGAYQATQRALGRFPSSTYVAALIQELPNLIERQPDWAGELVCGLANSVGTRHEPDIAEFRRQLEQAAEGTQTAIRSFLVREEESGWLEHRRGVLTGREAA